VDTHRLYSGDDPNYELWLSAVRSRVNKTNEIEASKMKKKGR
jgi:hypothetical protein